MKSSRLAWASALLFVIALFYAPLAYGCTRPDMLPPLFALLGASILLGGLDFLRAGRSPAWPRPMLVSAGLILAQGWWCTWDPVFHVVQFSAPDMDQATYERLRQISLQSMIATTLLLGAFLVLCELLARPDVRRFVLLSAAISGVLISVIGIFLKIVGPPAMIYIWQPPDIDWNDFAFFRYHGNAGAFLNLVWPLILVFTRRAYSPKISLFKKAVWTLASLACGAALLLNASKASLIIGLLILPWPFSTLLLNLRKRTLVPIVIAAVLTLGAAIYATSRFTSEDAFDRMINGSEMQASAGGRMEAYQQDVDALPQVGFFGVGPGLFQVAFPYQDSPLGNNQKGLREYAHEDYLQTVIEWGWFGSVWWFVLIAGGLYVALRTYAQREYFTSRTDRHLLLAGILGVTATLVQALVDFPLQIASLRLFFFTLLALCWMSPRLLAPPATQTAFPRTRREPQRPTAGYTMPSSPS